jgi:hypothetical protein
MSEKISPDAPDDFDDLAPRPAARGPLLQMALAAGVVIVILGPLLAVIVLLLGSGKKPAAKATEREHAQATTPVDAPPVRPTTPAPPVHDAPPKPAATGVSDKPPQPMPQPPVTPNPPITPSGQPMLGANLPVPPMAPTNGSGAASPALPPALPLPPPPPLAGPPTKPGEPLLTWDEKDGKAAGLMLVGDDDKTAILVTQKAARVIDLNTQKVVRSAGEDQDHRLAAFARDGQRFLSGALGLDAKGAPAGGTIKFWDVNANKGLSYSQAHKAEITALAIDSAGGRWGYSGDASGKVCLWDLQQADRGPTGQVDAHKGKVTCLAHFAGPMAGQSFLTSAGTDKCIRHWNLGGSPNPLEFKVHANVTALVHVGDGAQIITGHEDGSVVVRYLGDVTSASPYGIDLSKELQKLQTEDPVGPVVALALSPDGQRIIALHGPAKDGKDAGRGVIRAWYRGRAKQEPAVFTEHKGTPRAVAISRDCKWLLSAGDDHALRVWRLPD